MAGKGSAPGERRGGRKKGVPNKATAEIRTVAQEFGPAAVKKLAEFAGLVKGKTGAQSEQAQVAACKELLDRGYGKAAQPVTGEGGEGPVILELLKAVDGRTRGIPTGS